MSIAVKKNLLEFCVPSNQSNTLFFFPHFLLLVQVFIFIFYLSHFNLFFLCTSFLKLYNREGVGAIGLDEAAAQLGFDLHLSYRFC